MRLLFEKWVLLLVLWLMIGIGVVGFAIDVALRGVEAWFKRRWGQS